MSLKSALWSATLKGQMSIVRQNPCDLSFNKKKKLRDLTLIGCDYAAP